MVSEKTRAGLSKTSIIVGVIEIQVTILAFVWFGISVRSPERGYYMLFGLAG